MDRHIYAKLVRALGEADCHRLAPDEWQVFVEELEQHRERLLSIQRDLATRLPEDQRRRLRTRDEQQEAEVVRRDMQLVVDGVRDDWGRDERLHALAGLPGLTATERLLRHVRSHHEREVARCAVTWPRAVRVKTDAKKPMHLSDGTLAWPGDVFEVAEHTYEAFKDRLELVS